MDVSHIQLASQAASSDEVVFGAEGRDLRPAIGPHRGSLPGQAAAVQHLHSSTPSWDMSLGASARTEAMPGRTGGSYATMLGCMREVCLGTLLQAST